ncbi:DUF1302 domain-containing protein [Chromobacterium alticapitis]|uniref:DUF1302 domain-containing protein n=1 Tax=Chromobacterium alticapitis TaxID=2073169 RepID=A0A2S5DF77_9NEIS|nr:DUF1302 family protein [Chromobacterium alticapitis]POZ61661.1 DUF1302 domain-containing protein [Chromobacterium alticapitis]
MRSWRAGLLRHGAAALLCLCGGARAGEIVSGDRPSGLGDGVAHALDGGWTALWQGALGAGNVWRADPPSPGLTSGAGMASRNDGDLNYGKGDTVSRSVDAYLQLRLTQGDHGAQLSVKAWYDQALADEPAPHGNVANGYRPGPLSDAGFAPLSRFGNVVASDAYVFGSLALAQRPLRWRLGQQIIPWAAPTSYGGGLQQVNAVDYAATLRAGAPGDSANTPAPALYGQWQASGRLSVDGFYQFAFRSNGYPGCGAFYSINDYLQPGCDKLTLNGGLLTLLDRKPVSTTDAQSVANPLDYIARADDIRPSKGQYGVGWRYLLPQAGALGLFYADFTSRSPLVQVLKTGPGIVLTGPGGAPIAPAGEYREAFLSNRRLFAVNLTRDSGGGARLYLEYSLQPKRALAWNGTDFLNGALAGIGPLAYLNHLSSGAVMRGYDEFRVSQWLASASRPLPQPLGRQATLEVQFALRQVSGLPDPSVMRYGRLGFGMAPSAAYPACSSGAASCALDGFVTATAWGWRLKYQNRYRLSAGAWEWRPYLSYAQDVSGYSDDGQFSAGRHTAAMGLGLAWSKNSLLDLRYVRTGGGDYNLLQDRSTFSLSVQSRF